MALRLTLPGDVDEPMNLDNWLWLTEEEDTLDEILALWEEQGGPLVTIDSDSQIGKFLAPVIAIRGGEPSLPLHLLEFLFARFLVITPGLGDMLHPGYRFGATAVAPARLERVFNSLVESGLDTTVSSADDVVCALMTLHGSLSFADAKWVLAEHDLIPLGGSADDLAPLLYPRFDVVHAAGEVPQRRWLSNLALATMRCPRLTLAPFADMAGFCGTRATLRFRTADPLAPEPPMLGEFRAACDTLTELTTNPTTGDPAPLFSRGSAVVDFFRNRPWPPSLVRWPADHPDSLLDVRDRGRFFDGNNDARADVLRERFARVLRPLPTLSTVLNGAPSFEQHDLTIGLLRAYLPNTPATLLSSFQTLDATIARAWALVASPADTAAERVQQLVSQQQTLEEEDRHPGASMPTSNPATSGGGSSKGSGASSGWAAPVSFSRASACFVDAHRTALRRWLESPIVTAPLALKPTPLNAAPDHVPSIDEQRSGLLDLLRHYDYSDPLEALRVAIDKQALPVLQFLACRDVEHPHELFGRLANARCDFVKYISEHMLTSDSGILDSKDVDFKLSATVVDKLILGRWSEIHFHNDILCKVAKHRSSNSSVRPNNTKAAKQWTDQTQVRVLARLVESLVSALGFQRNEHPTGALAIVTRIDDFRGTAAELGLDYTDKACELSQKMLTDSGNRWAAFISASDPNRAFPPFALETDACFTSLKRAEDQHSVIGDVVNSLPQLAPFLHGRSDSAGGGSGGGGTGSGNGNGEGDDRKRKRPDPKGKAKAERDRARAAAAAAANAALSGGKPPGDNTPPSSSGLEIGAWASQSTVTPTTCTIQFRKRDKATGATTTSDTTWRIDEIANALGINVDDVCWPFAIMMAQGSANPSLAKESMALARCAHASEPGHASANDKKHFVPAGLDKTMLARFANP